MKKVIVIFLVVCFILYACSPSLYIPMSMDPIQQEKLLRGRKLYVSHCNRCHNLYLPKQYNFDKWQLNLNKMQERAKITNEEKQLIYEYLISQP